MRRSRFLIVFWGLILISLVGCGHPPGSTLAPVTPDELVSMLDITAGNVRRENRLAALLVAERIEQTEIDPRAILIHMSRCHRDARKTLRQLASGTSDHPVTVMASLLTKRRRWIRKSRLHTYLSHDSGDVRSMAVSIHGGRIPDGTLRQLSTDIAPRVRHAAVTPLCHRDDKDSTGLLADMLRHDPSPLVRQAVIHCVLSAGEPDISRLIQTLDNDLSGIVRETAAAALASIGTNDALEALRRRTAGPMTEQTVMVAVHLTSIRDATGQQRIEDALSNASPDIRTLAISRIHLALPDAVETASLNALLDEPQVAVRAAQQLLLLSRHTEAATTRLLRIWRGGGLHADTAEQLLLQFGHTEAIRSVTAELTDATTDERRQRQLLDRHRDAEALRPVFVEMMGHALPAVRHAAAMNVLGFCH